MKLSSINKAGLYILCLGLVAPLAARAQTITTVAPLDFGVIAIRDYNLVGRVTILTNGSFTYNGNVYIHENPQIGEYLLEGGLSNSFYTVTIDPLTLSLVGPGGVFTVDDFVVSPAVLFTDINGDDTFFVSGRLQTQGGGMNYPDGVYNTVFTVTVNF